MSNKVQKFIRVQFVIVYEDYILEHSVSKFFIYGSPEFEEFLFSLQHSKFIRDFWLIDKDGNEV